MDPLTLANNVLSLGMDRPVVDLTVEVRQQGAAAMQAQQQTVEFQNKILAQNESLFLAQQESLALLQRAGEAGSGGAALEEVVIRAARSVPPPPVLVFNAIFEDAFLQGSPPADGSPIAPPPPSTIEQRLSRPAGIWRR